MGCGGSKPKDDVVAPTRAADQDAAAATVQAAVRGNLSRQASKQKLESQKSIGESIAEGISNLFAPAPADAATETGAPGTAERRGSKSLLETIGTSLSEVTANIAEGVQSLFGDPVASRITIVPIKPKSQAAILATTAKTSAGLKAEPSMDGLISVCAFFTDDNRMVARSIFKDMESLKGSAEAQARVMGGFKEHMAGPPTPLFGELFWTLKGEAEPVAKPATRVTIVPLKPGSQQEVKAGLDKVNEIMKGSPVMGKMIEVGAFFTDDDKVVVRSVFVDVEAMEAGAEAAKEALGIVKESFAGPPEVIKGVVEWEHDHAKAMEGFVRPLDRSELLREVFTACDLDENGTLDIAEFKALAANQGAAAVSMQAALFATADKNKDAKLTVDEFLKANLASGASLSDDEFKAQAAAWQALADAKRSTKRRPSMLEKLGESMEAMAKFITTPSKETTVRRFMDGFFDGTAVEACADDATFNPPGAPPMPVGALLGLMKGVKDAFPDWRPVVMEVVEYADGSCTVLTQQKIGAMKGDLPAMGPFPAVKLDSVPEAAKTTAAVLPVEVGTFTFTEDGAKLLSGTYDGATSVHPLDDTTPFFAERWNKKGDLSDVGFGVLFSWLGVTIAPPPATALAEVNPLAVALKKESSAAELKAALEGCAPAPEEGERWEALPLAPADCAAAVGKDAALKAKHFGAMPLAQVARQFRRLGKGDTFSWDVLYCTATGKPLPQDPYKA